jgi:hypothetical protein
MKEAVTSIQDSLFIYTTYSFRKAVDKTYQYAINHVIAEGGSVTPEKISIKIQNPVPAPLEVSFPNMVLSEKISIFDEKRWKLSGKWESFQMADENSTLKAKQAKFASTKGDALEFDFVGTAISLEGNWKQDGGKAELYIDGKLQNSFDTYFFYNNQEQTPINICHALNLTPGKHTLKLVVIGEKKPESLGSRIYVSNALVFKEK